LKYLAAKLGSVPEFPEFPRARVAVALVILAIAAPAWSQSRTVAIDRDLRLFTMMAALNTAGFNVEFGGEYHPVRAELRKIANELDPAFVAKLRQFYESHKGGKSDELQLSKYVALALTLSGPPDFNPTLREEAMPTDAREVARFADFLKEFFVKARIPERWVLARPFYDHEAEVVGPTVRDAIRRADAYLRATSGTSTVHQMTVYVELAAPKNTVNVQNRDNEYFVLVGSSNTPRTSDIRHAYLHMSLDAALYPKMNSISNAQSLLGLIAREEGVAAEYRTDLFSMTRESLIRAVELRLDRPGAKQTTEIANGHYRSGLLLLPYFLSALPAYEEDDNGLPAYIPTLLAGLRVKDEQKRFQDTFHDIPLPTRSPRVVESASAPSEALPPPTPLNPMRALLAEAADAFNTGQTGKAKLAFEKLLESYDRENGTALFALAQIAGKEGDDKAARKYFDRVTRSPSAEPDIRVWAHIYLGRLDDLDCERARAIEHYQEAIKIGANTRNAQSIAKEGVAQSFSDNCGKP
jgi:tetratricopeptide (TPR) repeat protein